MNETGSLPPLEAFPKSQRVTFKFYEGVLYFLEENYLQVCIPYILRFTGCAANRQSKAEKHLQEAWMLCPRSATANIEYVDLAQTLIPQD